MDQQEAARETAVEMSKPGKFSLIERLQGRNMPEDKVVIYLDEGAAYDRAKVNQKLANATDPDMVAELEAELADLDERIQESAVTISMRGISSEDYEKLVEQAREQYPIEYEERQSAFSLVKEKVELPSPEREELFMELYLAKCITRAEMGGDIDEDITPDWVAQFKGFAPIDALARITETAYSLRMAVQWMDEIQSEDFSPRP